MRTMMPSLLILFLLSGATLVRAQLPPEILADSHLLRAEQAIRDGDPARAGAEIDKIRLLQQEHELNLSEEFLFRHAKAAAAAALPEQALEAVVKYLTATGREGPHYVEALELMNQAQDEIAGRTKPPAAAASQSPIEAQLGTDRTPEVPTEKRELLNAGGMTERRPPPACNLRVWNTEDYFRTATVQSVKACLAAGGDPNVQGNKHKSTPLHRAARHNENPAVVEALLATGADPMARERFKETPLHEAAEHNENPMIIQALLEAGADPDARTIREYTPLHRAARHNENPAVVEALLAAGADPMALNKDKVTPLHQAAGNENPAVVEALLAAGADPNARDKYKNTPLHQAAGNENPAGVEALLAAGADPNARDKDKNTPLHQAAGNENPAGVEALLAAGADPMALNKDKETPLHWAARNNENPAVIETFFKFAAEVDADWQWTPLHWAVWNENLAGVEALLATGADPMARTAKVWTPLHFAAKKNKSPGVIKALLAAGADLMARDKYKITPLHWAARNNENPAVVQALLAAGADPNARDKYKNTPLHDAVWNENPAVVQMVQALLAAGADPNARDKYKNTPLHRAARNNENPAVVQALLAAGADPNARDKYKDTPLHDAVWNENPAVVQMVQALLAAGADPNARDKYKNTPLHRAARNNENPAVVQALLAAGADPNARDKYKDTPLHDAVWNENPAVVQVVQALLAAGADPAAQNDYKKTPLDSAKMRENIAAIEILRHPTAVQESRRAADARRKPKSGPGWLEAAIGIAGGTAIAAAGGGSEEAVAAGTVFAEGVIGGQSPVGSSGGGYPSTPTGLDGSSGDFDTALRNMENSCGERYRSGFSEQDHWRFFCLDAFARYCALKKGPNQQQLEALKHDFAVLRSQGVESRCPYFSVLGGTYNENQPVPEVPKSDPAKKPADPVNKKRPLPTCANGDTVPIAVAEGRKPGCSPSNWCVWDACRSDECRRRYPKCEPGVLQ